MRAGPLARLSRNEFGGSGRRGQAPLWRTKHDPVRSRHLYERQRRLPARQQAAIWIKAFCAHLHDAGLGQISEIFDGDAPHQPRGCMAQAWSVAELLRAAVEDVLRRQPTAAR
jgi:glycogen debranching enzyme